MNIRSYVDAPPARRRRARRPASAAPASGRRPGADAEACDVVHLDPAKVVRLRRSMMAGPVAGALAETFRALGDPTRVQVVDALSREELCVCDLASLLGLSQSAASHQLRVLRALRLVRTRRAGRMVFYTLDDDHIVRLFEQGLRHVEEAPPLGRAVREAR
jgi:DNA-binding transcriptional ArsR family regulator